VGSRQRFPAGAEFALSAGRLGGVEMPVTSATSRTAPGDCSKWHEQEYGDSEVEEDDLFQKEERQRDGDRIGEDDPTKCVASRPEVGVVGTGLSQTCYVALS
jgi:hypothetical protein